MKQYVITFCDVVSALEIRMSVWALSDADAKRQAKFLGGVLKLEPVSIAYAPQSEPLRYG